MRIFITGASGFIGGAIARSLKDNHQVFAMARSEESVKKIKNLGITPIISDLNSIITEHLSNCDIVIHCAGYAEEWGSEKQFYQSNVEGTRNLLTAAKASDIKRFIFIGTEAALFHGQDMLEVTETYPYALNSPYPYSRTKAQGEYLVLKANRPDFQTISLRPRMVWGPNDQSILPTLIKMIKQNKFLWIGNGKYQTSTTHIDNLVHAVKLALDNGIGGEAYFIANDNTVSLREFLSSYLKTQGIEIPNRSMPKSIARFLAFMTENMWRLLKIRQKPPLVRFTIDIMSAHCTVNTEKAKKELKYQQIISTEEGLKIMPILSN